MPTTLEQLQYGFDRDSRRTWRQRATTQGWDNAYAYDSLSQVAGDNRGNLNLAQNAIAGVPATGSRWDYDETGNWQGYQMLQNGAASLEQTRTHDKGNRLMEIQGAAAMRTDRAGRMLQAVPGPQQDWSQSWQITWDAWSRITQVSNSEGNEIHRYSYDGITRRITRTNNQTGVTLRSYYNDQWRPVEERKNTGTAAELSYLWGAKHRDDLIRRDRAVGETTLNETRYILMDYFSPAAITDAAGAVKERYQFSAFGLRTILNPDFTPRTSSESGMEFGFQGQFEDSETGWMNYGYRYYLPALGRWSCKDPIEESGGNHLYQFVDNDPLHALDHLGLKKTIECNRCKEDGKQNCKTCGREEDRSFLFFHWTSKKDFGFKANQTGYGGRGRIPEGNYEINRKRQDQYDPKKDIYLPGWWGINSPGQDPTNVNHPGTGLRQGIMIHEGTDGKKGPDSTGCMTCSGKDLGKLFKWFDSNEKKNQKQPTWNIKDVECGVDCKTGLVKEPDEPQCPD